MCVCSRYGEHQVRVRRREGHNFAVKLKGVQLGVAAQGLHTGLRAKENERERTRKREIEQVREEMSIIKGFVGSSFKLQWDYVVTN